MRRIAICLALAAVLAGPAAANDGAAERAAGGLVFVQNDDIDMVSEDLFISARLVRVRYLFRNSSPHDVRITVAFPMPDHDLAEPVEGDLVWPADFVTEVDGRRIPTDVERRALLAGVDRSDILAGLGIPIAYHGDEAGAVRLFERLGRLSPAELRRLAELGLVRQEADGSISPLWTVRETWYWEQAFPAGRDVVIEHRYTPGAGGTVGTALHIPELRDSEQGRAWMERFCIDAEFLRAVDRLAARRPDQLVPETWVSYILTTGAGWRSPIGEFRLVVDKGAPANLVSFCGEGVRRLDATRFEMRRANWRPDRNLDILFLGAPAGLSE
ncbi:DUF4424 family protein [Sphingosinicella terrae]|uniref:DUF4424 family protein n=1 Tax=Sphingosinicella terrae TaxID=2172047 RepID=UPI000E0D4BA7|nr:DUF4424 family protein [Sphingosinicella terrae]